MEREHQKNELDIDVKRQIFDQMEPYTLCLLANGPDFTNLSEAINETKGLDEMREAAFHEWHIKDIRGRWRAMRMIAYEDNGPVGHLAREVAKKIRRQMV